MIGNSTSFHGEAIGHDAAMAISDVHDGWGSRARRSAAGCPQAPALGPLLLLVHKVGRSIGLDWPCAPSAGPPACRRSADRLRRQRIGQKRGSTSHKCGQCPVPAGKAGTESVYQAWRLWSRRTPARVPGGRKVARTPPRRRPTAPCQDSAGRRACGCKGACAARKPGHEQWRTCAPRDQAHSRRESRADGAWVVGVPWSACQGSS